MSRSKAAFQSSEARVISVWGAPGSPGRSIVAANVACELAVAGAKVLLIDLDTYAPSLAMSFGVTENPVGISAACRLVGQGRLDEAQIERLSTVLEAGKGRLSLLAGISSPARWPEITGEKLVDLLKFSRSLFDYTILDLAAPLEPGVRQIGGAIDRNQATRTALSESDQTLVVIAADPVGVARFLEHQAQLAELAAHQLFIANRLRTSVLGLGASRQIQDALARAGLAAIEHFIPNDPASCDQAARDGVPLAMMKRSSSARQSIEQLVRLKLQVEVSAARVAKLV